MRAILPHTSVAAALAAILGYASAADADEVRTRSMPWSVTVSPDGASLYVSHVGVGQIHRDNVYRFDAATLEVVARSAFRGHAVESVLGNGVLYVTNSREHQVVVLDPDTLEVQRRLRPGKVPKDLDLHGTTLYVANYRSGTVSVIDTESGAAEHIPTGRHTRGVAVTPDGKTVYAAVFGAGRVAVIDAASRRVVERVKACDKPRHIAITAAHALVTCFGARHVVVLDRASHEVVRTVRVGRGPKTIALAPDRSFAVTADEKANTISLIDLDTWQVTSRRVPVRQPCGVAVSPDGQRIYVTGRGSHELAVVPPTPDRAGERSR